MAKASPAIRSFNSGELSALIDGRTDVQQYPSGARRLFNYIAAPQGPAICRSGTMRMSRTRDEDAASTVVPFIRSDEQAKILEFAADRIRFLDDDGLQVYVASAATLTSSTNQQMVLDSAALDAIGAVVGDQVVLSGWPSNYNLNGEVATIVGKVGISFTLDKFFPTLAPANGLLSRVYHVPCVYTEQERQELRYVQSVDVVYLLSGTKRTRKLSRNGDYDWRLVDVTFIDGPYMPVNETTTTLAPAATGNAIPIMTSNVAPSGTCGGSGSRAHVAGTLAVPVVFLERNVSYDLPATDFFHAFDNDDNTYWAANTAQKGIISYAPAAPFIATGYTIYSALDNQDPDYQAKDYAPGTFTFEGFDGVNWNVLDRKENYVVYDNNKSLYFELRNTTAYQAYRLNITKCTMNGLIEPRVRRLVISSVATSQFALIASAIVGINKDLGFAATDIGRLIRLKGSDNTWRSCAIIGFLTATAISVQLQGEPLLDLKKIQEWRLGYWSDTTGWPTCGDFADDKLWLAGPPGFPDQFASSVTGNYETYSQTDSSGVVLDDSAIVGRLNSRRLARIRWIAADERGLTLGTGSEEYAISAPNKEALSARNIKARPSTRRGSANVDPVRIDNSTLFVQRSGRTLRECRFVFEADGYRSPSKSNLASHLGAVQFVELAYAAEPHGIVWVRRLDGTVVGLTYGPDENVGGWHQHDFGGEVVSMATIPQSDNQQDALWMVIKRHIDGDDKYFIERMTRFWDFDTELPQAHFVDCASTYSGTPIQVVYGLQALEGETIYGLADGIVVGPFVVVNGSVDLGFEASEILLGLGYECETITPRLENGAADGTAQGKVKRINSLMVNVWRSFGGEIGVYNDEVKGIVYEPLDDKYPQPLDELEVVELYTGFLGPLTPARGYEREGVVAFRKKKESPLPFHVISLLPQLNTQDG